MFDRLIGNPLFSIPLLTLMWAGLGALIRLATDPWASSSDIMETAGQFGLFIFIITSVVFGAIYVSGRSSKSAG